MHETPEELLEQLTMTRVPSLELEEKCFEIIRGGSKKKVVSKYI